MSCNTLAPLKCLIRWTLLLVCIPLFLSSETVTTPPKKKILVLCSNGGNGHNAAAGALKTLLKDQYELKIIYPIEDLRIWGIQSGEGAYNMALRNGWTRSVNVVSRYVAPKLFRTRKKKLESMIAKQIEQENPQLVISLIPFINYPASEAARKSNVPYLIITTDNDLQTWVHGLQGVSHPHFKVVVGTDLWCSREMLRKRNISDAAIETIGLPVRSEFLVKRDPKALRAEYQIPSHKPVVLIMIGGVGGEAALDYAENLGGIQMGVHLIACAGRNQDLASDLRDLKLHPTNTMTVMEFTDKIPELMAIADLIITKPGTTSITEALAMRIPILVDCTSPVLNWEQANIDLVMQYGVGDYIQNFEELEALVRLYLYDSDLRQQMQKSYSKIPANRFNESIPAIIDRMCALKAAPLQSPLYGAKPLSEKY